MNKIYYPAIIHPENLGYSVSVPDLKGCFTQGDTLEQALEMAQEAIGIFLGSVQLIKASAPESISVSAGDFLTIITFDKAAYMRRHDSKSVKKTLSIPSWLNVVAEEQHINFSGVLQKALKQQLNL